MTDTEPLSPHLEIQRGFERWLQTPLGRELLSQQRSRLYQMLEGKSGYHMVEIPASHRFPVAYGPNMSHPVVMAPWYEAPMPENTFVAAPHQSPIANNSVDLVVLHHTLDFSAHPHACLREADRMLRPGGQVIVVGFNPISLWGLRKVFSRRRHGPWAARFVAPMRVGDWMTLLSLKPVSMDYEFFRPPVQSSAMLERLGFADWWGRRSKLPCGAYYVSVAQKTVAAGIMRRPEWRRRRIVGLPVANRDNVSLLKRRDPSQG